MTYFYSENPKCGVRQIFVTFANDYFFWTSCDYCENNAKCKKKTRRNTIYQTKGLDAKYGMVFLGFEECLTT
jgi:hypothetical protein